MGRQVTVAILATLDTKGPETLFVKNLIEKHGHLTLVIDTGVLGEPYFTPHISRDKVAQAAGTTIQELISLHNEGKAISAMSEGAKNVIQDLHLRGLFDGVLALGGGQGAAVSAHALKSLPVGVPKLLISTKVGQANVSYYVGTVDVSLMPSVVDLAGLNPLIRKVLANAAGSVVGMAQFAKYLKDEEAGYAKKPVTAITMLGTTTKCGLAVKNYIESRGSEVLVFHSIGLGGRTMEDYLEDNEVSIVLDLSMNEIGNELFGGMAKAGEKRLTTAGKKGIPQVIAPGNIEFINFLDPDTVPLHYRDRKLNYHNPQATQVRLNEQEMRQAAREIARKLEAAKGPVAVAIPTKGFSVFSAEGGVYYDPATDKGFIEELENALPKHITVVKVDSDINSPDFIEVIIGLWEKMVGGVPSSAEVKP